jgi:hypothetical protein
MNKQLNPIYKYIASLSITTLLFFITIFGIHTARTANPKAQFSDSDYDGFPKQRFNTYTNVMYYIVAGVCFAMTNMAYIYLYIPWIIVGVFSLFLGISSTIFHGTNGVGLSGDMDVGSILPVTIAFFWAIVWSAYILLSWYQTHKNQLFVSHVNVEYWNPYPPKIFTYCGYGFVGCFTAFVWINQFTDMVNPSWEVKYNILGYLVFIISVVSGIVPGVFMYRLYSVNQLQNVDVEIYNSLIKDIFELIFGMVVAMLILIIGIISDSAASHALVMHLSIPIAMLSIICFYRDMYNMFERSAPKTETTLPVSMYPLESFNSIKISNI